MKVSCRSVEIPLIYLSFCQFQYTNSDVPSLEMKILKFGEKNEQLWWEKIGKVANRVKLAILSQSELLFVGKDGKS